MNPASTLHDRRPQRLLSGPRRRAPGALRQVRNGFTLIELLLSIVIFAVVLTAVNGVLFGAMRLRNKTEATLQNSLPLEHAAQTIRRDLAGTVPPGGLLSAAFRTGVPTGSDGSDTGLEFYSNTGAVSDELPFGNIQRIAYTLRDPTNQVQRTQGRELVRLVTRSLLGVTEGIPDVQWLMDDVQSLEFSFYNGTEWRDTWDSASEPLVLPQAVKILVARLPRQEGERSPQSAQPNRWIPFELVVPLMVTANTNQNASSASGETGGGPSGPSAPGGEGPRP